MEKQIKFFEVAGFDAENKVLMKKTAMMMVYNYLINSTSIKQMIKYSHTKYNQTLFKKQKKSNNYTKISAFYITWRINTKMSSHLYAKFYQKFAKFFILEYNKHDISYLP